MTSFFLSDVEMGKKDDDHGKKHAAILPPIRPLHKWHPAQLPLRKSLRRLLLAVVAGFAIYLFIANIPTDLPIRDRRRPNYIHPGTEDVVEPPRARPNLALVPQPKQPESKASSKEVVAAPAPAATSEAVEYSGPVRFLNLADSLHAITKTRGHLPKNRNILFAASNLQSAAALLPLACQMGTELRNYVHFALMSKSEISLDELREINGIDDSCHLIFHDARPEHSSISTEARMELSARRALFHINNFMHPQAVLIDGSMTEEGFFIEGTRREAEVLGITLIELPENAPQDLAWLSRLDSGGLAAWNKLSIDVVIQASAGATGGLIRLLKSLRSADYASSTAPHLTIELAGTIDASTEEFLRDFKWPPPQVYNPTRIRQLSLRHRISRSTLTEEESSVRFLESFWPSNPGDSHVLVLTPDAELSPKFYHYLKYTLLEYRYSNEAVLQEWDKRLMGISLDLPLTMLDAIEPFTAPSRRDVLPAAAVEEADEPVSFLWQAPNSNAVLFPGDKWVELHGFVTQFVAAQRTRPALPAVFADKLVSKRYPSWLEHALRLARARGYWTLYPGRITARNLAAVHNELYKVPEEYAAEALVDTPERAEVTLAAGPLLDSLPGGGTLPPFDGLPLLGWDGAATTLAKLDAAAAEYASQIRSAIGGCENFLPEDLVPHRSASDLFCVMDT